MRKHGLVGGPWMEAGQDSGVVDVWVGYETRAPSPNSSNNTVPPFFLNPAIVVVVGQNDERKVFSIIAEIGNWVIVCWGGHWRAAELICVEHMVHWRGRWRDAESVRVEQRRKTKRKNAKKGNGRKTKMKEEARHPGVVAL
ncbi:hypothetical protein BDQ17DRAFT_1336925 [Cyathus striatus]|nr:hypothetical protein BDQ17DRAFT_1336925 [Cyathus striatus]